jgi:hypothetical protein
MALLGRLGSGQMLLQAHELGQAVGPLQAQSLQQPGAAQQGRPGDETEGEGERGHGSWGRNRAAATLTTPD